MDSHTYIPSKISDIQLLRQKLNVDLKLPDDQKILEDYEELAIFVVDNFDIPTSHIEYVCKHFGVLKTDNSSQIINQIQIKNKNIVDYFDLDLPLRAVEVYFSFGNQKEKDIQIITQLKFLIAKLHYSIGNKYFNN